MMIPFHIYTEMLGTQQLLKAVVITFYNKMNVSCIARTMRLTAFPFHSFSLTLLIVAKCTATHGPCCVIHSTALTMFLTTSCKSLTLFAVLQTKTVHAIATLH